MNKTKYNLRHVACNMSDFNSDRHRFRFEYNKKEHIVSCYGSLDIHFNEETEKEIPDNILNEIKEIIWSKIDKEEKKWKYPKEAYVIADAYCKENFR
jgi:ArsR family metal-binding transcriptional regulator